MKHNCSFCGNSHAVVGLMVQGNGDAFICGPCARQAAVCIESENSMKPSIGWSKFASDRHVEGSGNSFFTISKEEVIERVKKHWNSRIAGHGETGLDRKVVVPVEAEGFFLSSTPLVEGLPIRAAVTRRQDGEDWFVETYIEAEDAKQLGINYEPATAVRIVCYSKEALLENNGERTTDDEWEIVAVLASKFAETEPMTPLTMARNFLEMPGGTKSVYTAQEFAESIYFHSKRSVKIKKGDNNA